MRTKQKNPLIMLHNYLFDTAAHGSLWVRRVFGPAEVITEGQRLFRLRLLINLCFLKVNISLRMMQHRYFN